VIDWGCQGGSGVASHSRVFRSCHSCSDALIGNSGDFRSLPEPAAQESLCIVEAVPAGCARFDQHIGRRHRLSVGKFEVPSHGDRPNRLAVSPCVTVWQTCTPVLASRYSAIVPVRRQQPQEKARPPPPTRGPLVLVRSSREESEEGGTPYCLGVHETGRELVNHLSDSPRRFLSTNLRHSPSGRNVSSVVVDPLRDDARPTARISIAPDILLPCNPARAP
jgi:hypothetical protein